jgi:DNA recombination protein Rad52
MFSDDQKKLLDAPLSRDNVKSREQAGRKVSYVEGWHVIAECNRIFGFGGWSSDTAFLNCVASNPRKIGREPNQREGFGVTYVAKVRITVGEVHRDGFGSGHGIDVDLGQAHEAAVKEAETDARKRALMSFGNQFGLALYDKEQANVVDAVDEAEATRLRFVEECKASIERIAGHDKPDDLVRWWMSEVEKQKRRDFGLLPGEVLTLKTLVTNHVDRMKKGPPV